MNYAYLRWVVVAILLLALRQDGQTCGLGWDLPKNHFDGVDEHGHVSCWQTVGEVDCGRSLVMPIHVNFNSKRDTSTPSIYLGQGWLIPLLESRFVQEDESRFVMIQPDGLNNLFLRRSENGSVLDGSAGWKGEIKDDTITAWATCGWKLVFVKGKISSMSTPNSRKVDWTYENGRVSELREGNSVLLKVLYDAPSGKCTLIVPSSGKTVRFTQTQKPQVQEVEHQRRVVNTSKSLEKVVFNDGREQSFAYDVNAQVEPTLSLSGVKTPGSTPNKQDDVRRLCWDSSTKRIITDNGWTYAFSEPPGDSSGYMVERKDQSGKSEMWAREDDLGREILGIGGIKLYKDWFVSGAAAGLMREISIDDGSGRKSISKIRYDEHGNILSILDGMRRFTILRNEQNWTMSVSTSATTSSLYTYDQDKKLHIK